MLLTEITAIKAKITAAGGDFNTNLSKIIADNALYNMPEGVTIVWDDAEEIVTVIKDSKDARFGPEAMRQSPTWTVVMFAYAQIQRFEFKFNQTVKSALAS